MTLKSLMYALALTLVATLTACQSDPTIIVMLVTALAAILIDEMIGLVIRRKKRKVLAEREELKRLRARADGQQPRIE